MRERLVLVMGYDDAEVLDIASVTTTLALANELGTPRIPYRVVLASPGGRQVDGHSGLVLRSQQALERQTRAVDTLVVSGGGPGLVAVAEDERVVGHLRRIARTARRVASVCTGAAILAATGLLDGRRVTTHWRHAGWLAARHPEITVDPDPIYVRDGPIYTAAGMTSALDLALAFVAEDHGTELARTVSRDLVTYLHRPGNQAQMSMFVTAPAPSSGAVRDVVDHVTEHLDGDLATATLAARAGTSERHLARLFLAELGMTPARYVRHARLEAAAQLLVSTTLPVAGVARRCGFGTAETLRQAFVARYGTSPARFRAAQAAGDGAVLSG